MSSDLTARARIRDAAIQLFAERGVDGATVRDIAQAAGVSSGLLRHHFGSKEGLRDACDEYVMARITELGIQFTETMTVGRYTAEVLLWQRYLVRSLVDGSPAGAALWDKMITFGEQWLGTTEVKTDDPRAYIAVISAMKMSMFLLRDQLSRALGTDVDTPEGWARLVTASVEIFSQPLVTPEQVEQARASIQQFVASMKAVAPIKEENPE